MQKSVENQKLHQKVTIAGLWVMLGRICNALIDFARLLIIGRLFSDNVNILGLYGIACLTIATIEQFSQTGFRGALVRHQNPTNQHFDTAWTMEIFRSFLLLIILVSTAPLLGLALQSPLEPDITASQISSAIQAISISVVLLALSNINFVKFTRELDFKKQFILLSSSKLVDSIATITLALIYQNIWAIIIGHLAGSASNCILSYILMPTKPKLSFNLDITKELWGFGKWIMIGSILVFLLNQGDDFFVGKVLGLTALGYYRYAYKISNLPATEICHTIAKTSLPAYARLQNDMPRFHLAHQKIMCLTGYISFLIAGLIFALSRQFIMVFLPKWEIIIPTMQILAFYGLARSYSSVISPAMQAINKHRISTIILALRVIILAATIYPLAKLYSFNGVAIAVAFNGFITFPLEQYILIKLINGKISESAKNFCVPMFAALIMVLTIFYFDGIFASTGIIPLIGLATIGTIVYLIITGLISKFIRYNGMAIVLEHTGLKK